MKKTTQRITIKRLVSKKIKDWTVYWPNLALTVQEFGRKEEVVYKPSSGILKMDIKEIAVIETKVDGKKCFGALLIYQPIEKKK